MVGIYHKYRTLLPFSDTVSVQFVHEFLYCINALLSLELYRGVTGSFFGIGILPVSDLLNFRYFGRYRSPPFLYTSPLSAPLFTFLKKGAIAPLLRKKGGAAPFLIRNVPTGKVDAPSLSLSFDSINSPPQTMG